MCTKVIQLYIYMYLLLFTDSKDMSLSKLQELVKDREACHAAVHGAAKSRTRLSGWTITTFLSSLPISVITEYWAAFPCSVSRSLLAIHFIKVFLDLPIYFRLYWVFTAVPAFLYLWRVGAALWCGARASRRGGLSCCRAWALGQPGSVAEARG